MCEDDKDRDASDNDLQYYDGDIFSDGASTWDNKMVFIVCVIITLRNCYRLFTTSYS